MTQTQAEKNRIVEVAENWLTRDSSDLEGRGARVKHLALAWSLTRESRFRDKALELFGDEYKKRSLKEWFNQFFKPDVHFQRLIADLAISYKLLESPSELDRVLKSLLRRRQGKLHSWRNNWYVRDFACMAMLAKLLGKDKDLARYRKKIDKTIAKLVDAEDGTYAEGPSYLLYMVQILNPYFDIVDVGNDRVARSREWGSHLLMPNGKLPPVDDSYYCAPDFYTDEADKFLWGLPVTPGPAATAYHSRNQTVLRREDLYVLALHESFNSGFPSVHEHFDLCSLVTMWNGREWHLDTGYPGFKRKWFKTDEPRGHNIVMKDGRPGRIAWRLRCFAQKWRAEGELVDDATVEMQTQYAGLELTRRVQIGDSRMVVEDKMNGEATVLWHVLGDMEITDSGAVWTQDGLRCAVSIEGATSLSKGKGYHSFAYNQIESHDLLQATGACIRSTFTWS